jgi:uncharacterized protein (TIGR00299 family) protein
VGIIDAADLPSRVKERANAAFRLIAEAEAEVHGSTPEKIHFHEVGMMDAIADVTLAMLGLEELGVTRVTASEIVVGSGTVECAHGVMPVPAPATVAILRGVPCVAGPIAKEMTTPTGAAIVKVVAEAICAGAGGALRPSRIGYGAGTRVFERHPNMLRAVLEDANESSDGAVQGGADRAAAPLLSLHDTLAATGLAVRSLSVLRCDLDDLPGQLLPHLQTRLMAAGAREVHWSANVMKKGRSGVTIEVLADAGSEAPLVEVLLRESPTLGVRAQRVERVELARQSREVELPGSLGRVRAKVASWGDEVLRAVPEFDDCAAIAATTGRPLADVLRIATAAARREAGLGA